MRKDKKPVLWSKFRLIIKKKLLIFYNVGTSGHSWLKVFTSKNLSKTCLTTLPEANEAPWEGAEAIPDFLNIGTDTYEFAYLHETVMFGKLPKKKSNTWYKSYRHLNWMFNALCLLWGPKGNMVTNQVQVADFRFLR